MLQASRQADRQAGTEHKTARQPNAHGDRDRGHLSVRPVLLLPVCLSVCPSALSPRPLTHSRVKTALCLGPGSCLSEALAHDATGLGLANNDDKRHGRMRRTLPDQFIRHEKRMLAERRAHGTTFIISCVRSTEYGASTNAQAVLRTYAQPSRPSTTRVRSSQQCQASFRLRYCSLAVVDCIFLTFSRIRIITTSRQAPCNVGLTSAGRILQGTNRGGRGDTQDKTRSGSPHFAHMDHSLQHGTQTGESQDSSERCYRATPRGGRNKTKRNSSLAALQRRLDSTGAKEKAALGIPIPRPLHSVRGARFRQV